MNQLQARLPNNRNFILIILSLLIIIITTEGLWAVDIIAVFPGEQSGDQFAISVCKAGDVNNDGYIDMLIGASLEDTGGDVAGKCYLYLGSSYIDTIPDLVYMGIVGEQFGSKVSGDGDLNGDGYCDIAIYASGGGLSAGTVYVFFGGYSPDSGVDIVLLGTDVDDRFGSSIALQGDLNGDNFDDLVVGAPKADSTGVVYIYFGGVPMDNIPDLILKGESSGDYFGSDVSTGGDINGDGYADLLVGAELNSDSSPWAGKAYVFFGGSAMDSIPDLTITGEAIGDGFGTSVEICDDVNGDSHDDFFISSPYFNADILSGTDAGKVYLFLGGPLLDSVNDGEIVGELSEDEFGYAISTVDANGDGLTDLIVGAPNYGGPDIQQGKVYLYHGGYPLNTTPDFSEVGNGTYDGLGISVAGLGMFNYYSDGTGEFVAGGWYINGTGEARLYGEPVNPTDAGSSDYNPVKDLAVSIYPNPCGFNLNISYYLPIQARVEISVYDVAGRKVAEVFRGVKGPGDSMFLWKTLSLRNRYLPNGVYFLRFRWNNKEFTRKFLLIH